MIEEVVVVIKEVVVAVEEVVALIENQSEDIIVEKKVVVDDEKEAGVDREIEVVVGNEGLAAEKEAENARDIKVLDIDRKEERAGAVIVTDAEVEVNRITKCVNGYISNVVTRRIVQLRSNRSPLF